MNEADADAMPMRCESTYVGWYNLMTYRPDRPINISGNVEVEV